LFQDIPSLEVASQDEEGDWYIVGATTERSNNPPPVDVEGSVLGEAQEQAVTAESNPQPLAIEDQGMPRNLTL
jgi:hypothetical protein